MKSLASVLIAGALLATSGFAGAANDEQEPKKEKKICRTEKATGSLTRRTRICLTAEEWRELNARTKRGLDEFGRSASGGKQCPPDAMAGC